MAPAPGGTSAPSSVEHSAPAEKSSTSHLVLEVVRGRTRHPRRPVNGSRFLIGAGVTCDLRLGGEDIPALHSLITIGPQSVEIEAIAATPTLFLNGQHVRTATIANGDVLVIGELEFVAHLNAAAPIIAIPAAEAVIAAAEESGREPADMSAAELVDLIEAEDEQVTRFEKQQAVGMQALLQAAVDRRRIATESKARIPAPHFLSKRPQVLAAQGRDTTPEDIVAVRQELEQVGRQLATLSDQLKATADRSSQREARYAAATEELLETQNKLASQLEAMLERVETLQAPQIAKPRIA